MSSELDRVKSGFVRLVSSVLAPTDYHALYPATVNSQNADGTLEVTPESSKIGPISKLPLRLGIPGASATVAAGGRVLVGFENGDPRKPYASLWDTSTLVALVINGGSADVAKVGSTVQCGPFTGQVLTGSSVIKVP